MTDLAGCITASCMGVPAATESFEGLQRLCGQPGGAEAMTQPSIQICHLVCSQESANQGSLMYAELPSTLTDRGEGGKQ